MDVLTATVSRRLKETKDANVWVEDLTLVADLEWIRLMEGLAYWNWRKLEPG